MRYVKLFENFEIVEPIKYGEPLNNREINFLKGYNVIYPEWILKDDNYYYVFDHRCENIKDLPETYIHAVCKKANIKDYTINDDHTVDVLGDVGFYHNLPRMSKIPLKFNNISGNFTFINNDLTTLEGSPKSVGGYFLCYSNKLTTLEGSPKEVGGSFNCSGNNLTTLEGSPKSIPKDFSCANNSLITLKGGPTFVGKDFYCYNNNLISLEGSPNNVGGEFNCYDNELTTLEGGPTYVGDDFFCHHNPLKSIEYKGVIKGNLVSRNSLREYPLQN